MNFNSFNHPGGNFVDHGAIEQNGDIVEPKTKKNMITSLHIIVHFGKNSISSDFTKTISRSKFSGQTLLNSTALPSICSTKMVDLPFKFTKLIECLDKCYIKFKFGTTR